MNEPITNIIRGAVRREGLTDKGFAEEIGMPYQTLQKRYRDPGNWRLYEWSSVLQSIPFTDDELNLLRKEVTNL